jgi:hypothetical protein
MTGFFFEIFCIFFLYRKMKEITIICLVCMAFLALTLNSNGVQAADEDTFEEGKYIFSLF